VVQSRRRRPPPSRRKAERRTGRRGRLDFGISAMDLALNRIHRISSPMCAAICCTDTHTHTHTHTHTSARAYPCARICNGGEFAAFMQIRACARGKFLIQFGFAYTPVLNRRRCIAARRNSPRRVRPRNNCAGVHRAIYRPRSCAARARARRLFAAA